MRQLSLALNILLLVLVAILFYLHFNSTKTASVSKSPKTPATVTANAGNTIAYFDMDSLQANYKYFKDADAEMKAKEDAIKVELESMNREYQKKMLAWQQKGPTMSQAEAEAAQREKVRMEERYKQRSEILGESVNKQTMEFRKNIKLKIETFLKEYNKDNRFSFIMMDAPELIYYKDSTKNITSDLLKGLNDSYKKK